MVGIHTPELGSERGRSNVAKNAVEKDLPFPILVDDKKDNWNAWGNSMWPSVYLIDKEGYVRFWWYGEMDWKDTNGHQIMRKRVEELLAEEF